MGFLFDSSHEDTKHTKLFFSVLEIVVDRGLRAFVATLLC
jgi:hypothetical protein